MKIGIIITTFLRPKLMYEIINSILQHWNKDYVLFIGDQSFKTDEEKLKGISDFNINIDNPCHYPIIYYNLPYDCGLSYARNFLFNKAKEADCEYVFLSADSYKFTQIYDFKSIINFLEAVPERGLVGFVETNKPDPIWSWDLKLISNDCFQLYKPKRPIIKYDNLKFQPCDVTQNFYLAKTKMVINVPHDNELKLCEHEDIMYRFKQAEWQVFFNDSIKCEYINYKPTEYNEKRRRIYNVYKKILLKKYNIKNWIKIDRS